MKKQLRLAMNAGVTFGIVTIFLFLIGFTGTSGALLADLFGNKNANPFLGLTPIMLNMLIFLALIGLWAGASGSRKSKGQEEDPWASALLGGLIAGLVHGILVGLMALLVGTLNLHHVPMNMYLAALLPAAIKQFLLALSPNQGALFYFALFTLTGFLGGESRALTEFLTGPARTDSFGPSALLPIFRAGQIRNQVRLSEAQQKEMLAAYEKAIYGALREVSDALAGHYRTREQRIEQEKLVAALSESVRLSTLRYKGGLDSYLEVLDAERSLFQGQLVLAGLKLVELESVVQLYRALGGGWE